MRLRVGEFLVDVFEVYELVCLIHS